ncbi:enoyl-CoA hydratase/isomerase family protein [Baekduia soli]|uniref:enoyl-CoA hydratase/isomerase family protein n=1 Tax=Baekduia soli TaxID=496014 RepID=UPI001E47BDE1|nr:enoyl-CoA hydratase-related protein [Baekduia soli]
MAIDGEIGPFRVSVDARGIASVVFSRPPVNAVSIDVYEAIGRLADAIAATDEVRVVVLSAPAGARAWCGGADLNDFVGITPEGRTERYDFINRTLPRLYDLDRPVIAAINGHAVGIGVILAATCDLRVAADDACFSCPEIDFGLVAGGAGLMAWLKMPEGVVREMLYTGRRFTAGELAGTGFFNYIVAREEVVPKAMGIAELIAAKSLPAIKARKATSNALEGLGWHDAYLLAQRATAALTAGEDGQEGVRAFLEGRAAQVRDA